MNLESRVGQTAIDLSVRRQFRENIDASNKCVLNVDTDNVENFFLLLHKLTMWTLRLSDKQ